MKLKINLNSLVLRLKNKFFLFFLILVISSLVVLSFFKKQVMPTFRMESVIDEKDVNLLLKSASLDDHDLKITSSTLTPSKQSMHSLNSIQTLKKGCVHCQKLSGFSEKNELKTINEVKKILFSAFKEHSWNKEKEKTRIFVVDYFAEKLLGRIDTNEREQIISIMKKYVEMPVMNLSLSERQKKSIIGDKIELMMNFTRFDEEFAIDFIANLRKLKEFSLLKVGIENGLWLKGYSSLEVKDFLSQI